MIMLVTTWVFGAIPIIFMAWVLRKIFRRKLLPISAITSILAASVVAFFVRGFAEGRDGFDSRIDAMLTLNQIVYVGPQMFIALSIVLFVGWCTTPLPASVQGNQLKK